MSIFKKGKGVKASEFASVQYKPMAAKTNESENVKEEPAQGYRLEDMQAQTAELRSERPLWFRLYQNKARQEKQPYSPVLMVLPSRVQAIHPNVFDPDKADILVGSHWYATVHPFDEVVFSVYGVVLENDNPAAHADWQRLKNDKRVKKMKNEE